MFFVRADEIDWIEAAGNYVKLHVGAETHLLRETMNALEAQLRRRRFFRIHRSHIVNIERVKELQPWFNGEYVVFLRTGARLTLSRGYREKLQERIGADDCRAASCSRLRLPRFSAHSCSNSSVWAARACASRHSTSPSLHQPRQRLLERKRALLARDRDLLMQMLQRVLADVLARAVADHQQLRGRHQPAADPRQQHLGHDRGQRHRQLLPDRVLPLDGKRVGDARHGRGDVGRVQRRQHEVPGLGRRQRDPHRLRVAHLADDDHVRRLPQRGAQRRREIRRVDADLDLLDDAAAGGRARTRSDPRS